MKLLILSFYYAPDLCAGSFRCTALVEELRKRDIEIEVITTLPNRYAGFSAEAPKFEQDGNVTIHRVALPAHDSGMADQARAFGAFYRAARRLVRERRFDGVFATSSRLFTAFLGARIARSLNVPLYLDIRDIFVDTLNDVLPKKVTWAASPVLNLVERYTFSRAGRINLVSAGFAEYFRSRYPNAGYSWFTNGIDQEFLSAAPVDSRNLGSGNQLTILYAGNIGEGQGLHKIVPTLALELAGKAKVEVIGAGGRLEQLKDACSDVENVSLLPPVSRSALIDAYRKADVLFLHLNDYDAFKKVLPSKIFEYAALGKPILAGVGGYAADFIREHVSNAAVFEPGDVAGAVRGFEQLSMREEPRIEFVERFARTQIMNEMADDILSFMRGDQRD
ncbi:Glycosyltransferase involved in cell wall bisynthesis [Pseudidiomarina maritima]|uniref:Glycosyltransferase involved in cell wall bisynthesis n=1 Tax=Pseudidiomarina maritima TaxID=519453 RepID=A0A1I6GRV9_9GAMM|nr:glycosyltransferase family 4 protein [Pseudidiomarina maritima]SFR44821.1 Glycosyltransferase involved in cell wall bisynthesis [Pseudidiomarina maritima]